MNRRQHLARVFAACAAEQRAALIAFLPVGDPDLASTPALARAAAHAGVDIIELGFPFSDPLADGPVIQDAYARALAAGATTSGCLECVRATTAETAVPIVLMTAWNLVLARGCDRFCADAAEAGVTALLVPDLLAEDTGMLAAGTDRCDLAMPLLIGPDSDVNRVALIARRSSGFVYLLRRRGVTGTGAAADDLPRRVALVREHGSLPVAMGFGIESPDDAREVAQAADAVIVGSALARLAPDAAAVAAAVREMADACRRPVPAGSS